MAGDGDPDAAAHLPSRWVLIAAALMALLVASCSQGEAAVAPAPGVEADPEITSLAPPATLPPTTLPVTTRPPTTLPVTTVPTVEPRELAVRLHPVEALASRGGPAIEVGLDGRALGRLTAEEPSLAIRLEGSAELSLTYVTAGGLATGVSWTQAVDGVAEELVIVQPWRRPDREASTHVVAWSRTADEAEARAAISGPSPITVHSPLWWFIDGEGGLAGAADPDFVAFADANGVAVWPAVQGIDADALHLLVTNPEHRAAVASDIAADARSAGAHGVNIDLEGFRVEDAPAMSAFIEELAAAVHEWGGVVSYDLVPRSDSWDVTPPELAYWSTAPERRRIAAAVDYTILMAYDQHNRFRPAGPVAAPNWVEEMLVYQLRYSDPQDVILGLPAYGRIWDAEELDAPRAVSLGALEALEGTRTADPAFEVDRIDLADGRFYWAEYEIQARRAAIAIEYGLSGVAVWRLGLDAPSLWEALP